MAIQRDQHSSNRVAGFWKLVSQSCIRFPKALVPWLIVFGWGIVVGRLSVPRSAVEVMYERVQQKVNDRLQAGKKTPLQDRNEASRGGAASYNIIDPRGIDSTSGDSLR